MKEIILTQNKTAFVDDCDYTIVSQFKWCAHHNGNVYYAVTNVKESGKYRILKMHQMIIGKKEGYDIDHKDGNGLNNQRENLQHISHRKNLQSRHHSKISKYPGVCKDKNRHRWRAMIRIKGVLKNIGTFEKEEDAACAYRVAEAALIDI